MSRPNILIIVADDLGFTDTSPFGGEIKTPNLQALASQGLRFTNFHTASACSPTRSMLLSGTDNHIAGLGQMAEFARGYPEKFAGKKGYEGVLNDRVAPLPAILKDAGYYTWLAGKWHLGLTPDSIPSQRGFEKSFSLLPGAGNYYKYFPKAEIDGKRVPFMEPIYVENDRYIDAEKELPDDFYTTNYFTDKAIEFLKHPERNDRPFFGFLTYTAPHWPFQAPKERIAKYKGVYDKGPAVLREARLAAAKELGIIPDDVEPHPIRSLHEEWSQLSPEEQKRQARIMEIYAAMVDIQDEQIGRVIQTLKDQNEFDNTAIYFLSDNGAEGFLMEAMPMKNSSTKKCVAKYFDNSYENLGNKDSWVYYNDQWAQAATAPSYMYKMWASEGGIRTPLILRYPKLTSSQQADVKDAFVTVMDILPTVLEFAGVKHPGKSFHGREVAIPRGQSWLPYLIKEQNHVHDSETVTGWELFGQQAVRKGDYKALFIPKPFGSGEWELYNITKDQGEIHNLATKEPEKLEQMLDYWSLYVAETGLIELGNEFEIQNFLYDAKIFDN